MIPIVADKIKEIQAACRKYAVQSLFLIGSAARTDNQFTLNSDIDFVLQYKKDKEGLGVKEFDYFELLFELEKILGKKVDLVVENSIRNYIFKQSIEKDKIKIYAA